MSTRLATLAEIEAAVWRELAACAAEREHPWRRAVLATANDEGADARIVIVREVDAAAREIVFFCDARSPKIAQIQARPAATLVAWSPALAWQLRLRVTLGIETAGLAVSSRWARLALTPAALDYLAPCPPGSALDHPQPQRGSRAHFAVVTAHVREIDWLELHADGHRRALFAHGGARWLQP